MKNRKYMNAAATLVLLSVAACGGGGGGGGIDPPPPPPPPPPPIAAGPFLAMGPMPQSGPFVIGDVRIETGGAQVFINDQPGSLQSLRQGHLVRIVGSTDGNGRSRAEEIYFTGEITGPVDSVDLGGNRLVVMGQPVTLSDESVLTTPLQNFTRGEVVQVSGFTDANGDTEASRIDYSVSNRELRLVGTVSNLDSVNFEFTVNGLTVDYSSALTIDVPLGPNLPAEQIVQSAEAVNAKAVALSVTYSPDGPELAEDLGTLRDGLDRDIPLILGGRAAPELRNSLPSLALSIVGSLAEFGEELERLQAAS